jgi:hypothetical protein
MEERYECFKCGEFKIITDFPIGGKPSKEAYTRIPGRIRPCLKCRAFFQKVRDRKKAELRKESRNFR